MSLVSIRWQPSPKDLRVFAGLQFVFSLIIFGGSVWRSGWSVFLIAVLLISAGIAIVGGIIPKWVQPVYLVWMVVVFPIGWVVSHLLLGFVYYAVLTPIGLLLRWTGRDPLDRHRDPNASTYWKERPSPASSARYFDPF